MLVSRSQSSQSSTSLRVRRLPVPGTLGSFRLGPTNSAQVIVRQCPESPIFWILPAKARREDSRWEA